MPTGCLLFLSEDYEQLVPSLVSIRSGDLRRHEKGAPHPRRKQRSQHTGSQHSFGSEDDKRLVPTGCWHSFWSLDDEVLVSAAGGSISGGLRRHDPHPLREQGSQLSSAHWLSAFVWDPGGQPAGAHRCPHSFWSYDDDWLVPPSVGTREPACAAAKGVKHCTPTSNH